MEIVYPNNSIIPLSVIGETDMSDKSSKNNALQCITDKKPCCREPLQGEWKYINSTIPTRQQTNISFYTNRGLDGTVNLNRLNDSVMFQSGLYCCLIPNAKNVSQTLCVDIGK